MRTRARDERGVALPTPVAMISVALVAAAGLFFLGTGGQEHPRAELAAGSADGSTTGASPSRAGGSDAAGSSAGGASPGTGRGEQPGGAASTSAPSPQEVVSGKPLEKRTLEPVQRGEVYLEIYNNSNITGLASATTERASSYGWQVVATDNWYGTIPASTIYYPDRLYRAAQLLAEDLGVSRVMKAVDPMSGDRLTVVLTDDYTG